ncbi:MAG TPA: proton-conducting transporter membrane subunit [Nitrospira sp.]|jgi:NADH-quinone oxidoreductase subunit L|nr:proton-conducting transporter membrane subunit [Nitrospira sp.]
MSDLIPISATLIAIGAPLISSAAIALFSERLGERSARIGIWALVLSTCAALFSLYQLSGEPTPIRLSGPPSSFLPILLVDRLAAVMMVLITVVSLVIHVYSQRYMRDDSGYVKFFGLLSLLTFVLLTLVSSGHLIWLFLSWHAVTWLLRSLLNFNAGNAAARMAGRTTLRVQGIGDAAFLGAIVLIYATFGTFDLSQIFELANGPAGMAVFGKDTWFELRAVTLITLLMVITVMTKSAQFPFHIWLAGTIEAPTPVSAMLHAGIVNAGGFLVNRLAPLFGMSPPTLYILFIVGALTALIGASTMLTQSSIKRTLVFSTMGQMGYMVMECGLGAFALAVFHLCAHGLFKATLFLNSGTNIHDARVEFKLPDSHSVKDAKEFALMPWITGLAITLMLPLIIVLMAHGLVNIPLFESQGTLIFLFFAWVTSAQATFSLYRLHASESLKVSLSMVATLTIIGFTYLWAGEAFTHFLYPVPGQVAAYFEAASWNQRLFDSFLALTTVLIVAVWVVLYGKAHGMKLLLPSWLDQIQDRLYVALLSGLYVEALLRAAGAARGSNRAGRPARRSSGGITR